MYGYCLCKQVGFRIKGSNFKLYQCHCSLCRKQTGSSSNTATIIAAEKFRWLCGTEYISSWIKESGFRSDFCSLCGSPLPNPIRNLSYLWVPAGLLEGNGNIEIVAHLCLSSKTSWDLIARQGLCYEELPPNFLDFIDSLQTGKT